MRARTKVVLCIGLLILTAVGGGLWWFFHDDAPPAVALATAVESVTDGTSDDSGDEASAVSVDGIDGDWVVDATSGDFDYESATGTFAGFRIAEELASIGSTTAVGRTGDVSGSITIDGTVVTAASFEVDLTSLTTNESRRDQRVQDALVTVDYPTATFELTELIELGEGAAAGDAVTVTAVGELTIHGVTREVELPLEAQLVDETVVVVGSLDITFSDYDVEVPDSQVVLSVEDHGTLELQLLLVKS